ncbi:MULTISPECIES: M23 family metallopeptidase [unclassified Campylobacter]|uniref:M23 family metallopeptidase n=1 Tax=unclassified Campylobacter TaxID=2593542 RepID=UPI0012382CFF|nr:MULTISPECIES: M23 family metallopeptidase [unclassified Campylobacter]KAA6225491.1 M23 family metallopeptidase [Campylobacter sp. LR196d]KAA6227429.1 M23 family metallopeptidase [Campylobacter sp. LR185c]KAA6229762.1 M23 family metallopeptidase [Campylobacter sp. LR286c]KAA6234287.1 M23 family metallopeptidase [Campylobacter sp. LR291e]KAA8604103.1 peptidase M23 [Campylobacter sp. LR185c]
MKHIFLSLIIAIFCHAYDDLSLIKGQALFLEFDKKDLVSLKAGDKNLPFFAHPSKEDKVAALFGISYKNPPTSTKITATYKDKTSSFNIKTLQGNYKSEKLQVEPKKINPPKEVQERIAKELKEANAVYTSYTNKALFDGKFEKPLNSVITSDFGKARVYNNMLSGYHGGTDFRAQTPTPIKAANSGVVRIAKDRYYAGGSVIIDHGYGIYSQYYHLSQIDVKVGQEIKKGDIIGLSGATGRVSGPHLHFGIFANSKQVDPLDFIEKFNLLWQ